MLKVILTVGIPGCGKSTWAKEEVRKDPEGTVRICRDDLRNMLSNYHFSDSNEKMVTETKNFLLTHSLKKGRNVILDETNINRRNFEDVCETVKNLNINCVVMEKSFFVDLDEAISRDSQRIGSAKVGEEVVRKFWKKSGGNQHKFFKPRVEIITKDSNNVEVLKMNPKLPKAAIFDLDGTMCDITHRDPYDASKCLDDKPYEHVLNLSKILHSQNIKIIFVSGREDKYEELSRYWLDTYFNSTYELYMRPTNNFSKDFLIKKDIYEKFIKDKYNIIGWFDDRLQVCKWVYNNGLPLFRVNDPEANF